MKLFGPLGKMVKPITIQREALLAKRKTGRHQGKRELARRKRQLEKTGSLGLNS